MTEGTRPMMYSTPILDRRPRPPGTVPHRSLHYANIDSPASSSTANAIETPLSRQMYTRRPHSTPAMAEADQPAVGLGLESSVDLNRASTIVKGVTDHNQPSPPPPYGVPLTSSESVSTPPTQDIDDDPLDNLSEPAAAHPEENDEEELRRERATDLAKSLGLAVLSPTKSTTEENFDDEMNAEEIKQQLRQMQRRLRVRDHELVMAAKAADYLLRQHEELVASLPPDVRRLLPRLHGLTAPHPTVDVELDRIIGQSSSSHSSPDTDRISYHHTSTTDSPSRSSGTKRLFRTVRNEDTSKPYPHHHNKLAHARNIFNTPKRRTSFSEIVQQESDERLILLERALSESRENEEIQRKLAARLKRDFEKLQRDFDHAEQTMSVAEQTRVELKRPEVRSMDSTSSVESMTSSQFDSWAWKQTLEVGESEGDGRALRPKASKLKLRIKPRRTDVLEKPESDSAWGSTKFPEFPGEAGPSIGDRLTRLPPRPTFNRLKAKLRQPSPKKSSPRHHRLSSASEDDLPAPSPRRALPSPSRSSRERYFRPTIAGETFRDDYPSRSTSRSPHRGSPSRKTPSKSQTPLRGRYDSISSQLASVRKFVSNSVRSVGFQGSRSLGSELGSEYGDHDQLTAVESAYPAMKKDEWEDEDPRSGSDGTDGPFTRPMSIPANASIGLTSLAMALSCSPVSATSRLKTPRRTSPPRSPVDEFDPGSYRPKKGRRNWIRPLLLPQGLDSHRRPMMHPRTSSDGTLALAHRRQKSSREELYDLVQEISMRNEGGRRERQLELNSPPARLVNDLIILLSVMLEWIEMFIVIVYRVSVAVKYGRESIFRTWRQGKNKRYYL